MQRASRLRVVAVFAAVAFGSTAALLWPTATFADSPAEVVAAQGAFPEGFTKIGPLRASSRFVQDERVKSKWWLELKVENPSTEGPERGQLEVRIEKSTYEPESRGMPVGVVVWKGTETVVVPAGEALTLRRAIPPSVSWGVHQAQRPIPEDAPASAYMRARTTYRAYVVGDDGEEESGAWERRL